MPGFKQKPGMFAGIPCDSLAVHRSRLFKLYFVLGASNGADSESALTAFPDRPVLLGTALLAYTFGLRHAFDADPIAAIDNATRKFMHEGRRPTSIGRF